MAKIVALHIAGAPAENLVYGTFITQEDLSIYLDEVAPKPTPQAFPENLEVIEQVRHVVHVPTRPAHTPSLFAPFIADELITKRPARVAPFTNDEGDRLYPLDLALDRLCKPGLFSSEVDLSALRTAETMVASLFSNADVGECTLHQALNGIEGNLYAGPIDLNTSGGWDPDHSRSGGDKHFYVCGDAPYRQLTEAGQSEFQRALDDHQEGVPLTFSVHLKQELLPEDKVSVGRTRLTHCMRFGDFILFRMKFLRLIAWTMKYRRVLPLKVGTNPYDAYEWSMLARSVHLDEPDEWLYMPGDFKNFDGSQSRAFIDHVIATFSHFVSQDAQRALTRAMHERYLIVGGTKAKLTTSHPTGWYLTTLWNCIATALALNYARVKHCIINPDDVLNIIENMALAVYGDDNIATFRKGTSITWEVWRDSVSQLGLTLTPAIKNRANGLCSVEEVTFLQRFFVRVGDVFSCPLTEDHVENILAWRHRSTPPLSAAVDAM